MLFVVLVVMFCAPVVPFSWAAAQWVYNKPPVALSGLSQDEINTFGQRLVPEACEIRAKVAKPSGDVEYTQAKIDFDAVKAVVDLYDDDAMIQWTRLSFCMLHMAVSVWVMKGIERALLTASRNIAS